VASVFLNAWKWHVALQIQLRPWRLDHDLFALDPTLDVDLRTPSHLRLCDGQQ